MFWRKREDPTHRELAQRLTALPLFVGLERSALDALVAELEWIALPGGTLLYDQGEEPDALYVLLYGRLLAERRDRAGRWQPVGSIGAGESVGEAGLLAGEPRGTRVSALRDCELLRLSGPALERVATLHPQPMLRMARFALRRYALTRESPAPPTCFALLPATRGVDAEGFAHQLLAEPRHLHAPSVGVLREGGLLTESVGPCQLPARLLRGPLGAAALWNQPQWLDPADGDVGPLAHEPPAARDAAPPRRDRLRPHRATTCARPALARRSHSDRRGMRHATLPSTPCGSR